MGIKHSAGFWTAWLVMGAVAALVLSGCATNTGASTASGRPERTVHISADVARAKITAGMINKRFSLRSNSSARLVFYRPGNTGTGGLIAAAFGAEAAFVIIPQGNSTRVMVEVNGVQYPDTSREVKSGLALNNWNGGAEAMADINAVLASL